MASGEVDTTASGGRTSPFPRLDLTTERCTARSLIRVEWLLIDNATWELTRRRASQFSFAAAGLVGAVAGRLTPADIDTLNSIVFDPEFPV